MERNNQHMQHTWYTVIIAFSQSQTWCFLLENNTRNNSSSKGTEAAPFVSPEGSPECWDDKPSSSHPINSGVEPPLWTTKTSALEDENYIPSQGNATRFITSSLPNLHSISPTTRPTHSLYAHDGVLGSPTGRWSHCCRVRSSGSSGAAPQSSSSATSVPSAVVSASASGERGDGGGFRLDFCGSFWNFIRGKQQWYNVVAAAEVLAIAVVAVVVIAAAAAVL